MKIGDLDTAALGQVKQAMTLQQGIPVEKSKELRKSVGLEEVPPTVVKFPDLLKKFQDMLKKTEIVKNNDYMFKE